MAVRFLFYYYKDKKNHYLTVKINKINKICGKVGLTNNL